MNTSRTFLPTPELIEAAELLFAAKAWVNTVKPIVRRIQQSVLDSHEFHPIDKYKDTERDGPIKEPERTYLMTDSDFEIYFAECKRAYAREGLHTDKPEFCPLLVAENIERQARDLMLERARYITNIDHNQIWKLEFIHKLEELTCNLLSPFVDSERAIQRLIKSNPTAKVLKKE